MDENYNDLIVSIYVDRFHKLVWGSNGITGDKEHPSGIIVGGCDGGVMQIYDAAKILKNENPLVLTKTKHAGAVRALDCNPFRVSHFTRIFNYLY